jgi:molybdopterin molybdotransferase
MMITREEAYRIVVQTPVKVRTETIDFQVSYGRILAEDVRSDIDMPPFNRAAVDGYACRREDLGSELEIMEIIRAGKEPVISIGRGQCAKIMTGAKVPDGCDYIFMVEYARVLPSGKVLFSGVPFKENIAVKGEDVKNGEIVLKKGKIIRPQDIAVFASVGHTLVQVAMKPAIAVISTGDELVEPAVKPGKSGIRNSNSYQLVAQVERTGATAKYYGIAPDDEDTTFELIRRAINENDLVLLTGGVSMGDYDFVPSVLGRAGVKILFDQVKVQPGKPTTFGIHPDAVVFGLPGNPVSAFVQFETLVRPLIYRMMGHEWKPSVQRLPLARRFERKSSDRAAWIPVTINENNEAMPSEYHGSAHITALPYADGLVSMDPGQNILEKGEMVSVRQI